MQQDETSSGCLSAVTAVFSRLDDQEMCRRLNLALDQPERDIAAVASDCQGDPQVSEVFQEAGLAEWAGINGLEPHLHCEVARDGLGARIVTAVEHDYGPVRKGRIGHDAE